MTAAGLCWSTGGILVRSVTIPRAREIVFWRASFMALFIGIFLIARYGSQTISYVAAVGFPGLLAGAFLASSFFLFILSVMRTTVANSLFLMSSSPFVAALFGWLFLNEHVSRNGPNIVVYPKILKNGELCPLSLANYCGDSWAAITNARLPSTWLMARERSPSQKSLSSSGQRRNATPISSSRITVGVRRRRLVTSIKWSRSHGVGSGISRLLSR